MTYFYGMNKKQNQSCIIILLIISFLLFFGKINSPVKDRHAWAMADHFAISLGFIDNGFDFFHPKTFCLNPQFSANKLDSQRDFWTKTIENPQGITAIDFPIHHYCIAVLMKILNTRETYVFRLYMLAFSLLGLYYLFKSAIIITKSFYFSISIILFTFLLPSFSYYAIGFLPSQIGLSILFISLYHFLKHKQTHKFKYFLYFLSLLTLASLTRFPFLIYIIGLLCLYLFLAVLNKKIEWKKMSLSIAAISVVLLYFFYNKYYLSENFGSNFLNYPLPADSLQNFVDSIIGTFYHQSWRYFTIVHYILLLLLFTSIYKNRSKIDKSILLKETVIYLCICSIGISMYMFLMIQQFVAHEYYMFDTFLPILIFWILVSSKYLKFNFTTKKIALVLIPMFIFNKVVYHFGYAERINDPLETTRKNFQQSEIILDSLGIHKESKILLLDSYSPNLAFINMNRNGYCVMTTSTSNITNSLNWNYDYIITQNFSFDKEVLKSYPNFNKETSVLYSNDKFTIHTKK